MGELVHFPLNVPLMELPEDISMDQATAIQQALQDPRLRATVDWLVENDLLDNPVADDYAKEMKHEVMTLTWGVNPLYCDVAFQACVNYYQKGKDRRANQA